MTSAPLSTLVPLLRPRPEIPNPFVWLWQHAETYARGGPAARAARAYAALTALSDAELAARGLRREDLAHVCFGRLLNR